MYKLFYNMYALLENNDWNPQITLLFSTSNHIFILL